MLARRTAILSILSLGFLSLLLFEFRGNMEVAAQEVQPPPPADLPGVPQQAPDGTWYVLATEAVPRGQIRLATVTEMGGPDNFGYTWRDEIGEWIDTSKGIDTGLTGFDNDRIGPIDIGFPFKYYENTYTSLYISVYGFVTFQAPTTWWPQQAPIPNPRSPNNVIAPFWVPVDRVDGYVRYLQVGSSPNRHFVVEWNQVVSECCGDDDGAERYTFQLVLEEDGDIWLQYRDMQVDGGYVCGAAGMEDSTGLDGLAIGSSCTNALELSNRQIHIRRPPPMARVKVLRPLQGSFVRPGEILTFTVPLRNTGELGPDTYEIESSSTWTTTLSLRGSPLVDTNDSGQMDTGVVEPLETVTLTARIQVPENVATGSISQITITARSTRDATQSGTTTIRTAVPTSFVQVFREYGQGGAMQVYMVQPSGQAVREFGDAYGWDGVIAELPSEDFLYLWRKGRYDPLRERWTTHLEYVMLDRYGNPQGPVLRLTDHSQAAFNTTDSRPAVDVAESGWIGMAWPQYSYRWDEQGRYLTNYNMYTAILDPQGQVMVGPLNLTRNTAWGTWQTKGVPHFYTPRIVATNANRFFVAWHQQRRETDGYVDEIWYAVLNRDGTYQITPTQLTQDTPGWDEGFQAPVVEHLDGERVLVLFRRADGHLYFTTVDAGTGATSPMVQLAYNTTGWMSPANLLQMPDGRLALALRVYGERNLGEQGWQASYFNNMTLSGTPAVTRQESQIKHSWGLGSPDPLVNADQFSARWEGTLSLPPGEYRFEMFTDDGGRLWIDDQLVLDRWDSCCQTWNTVVRLRGGAHTVRMEMFERDGAAGASLNWYRIGYSTQLLFFNESGAVVAGPVALNDGGAVTPRGPDTPAMSLDSTGRVILTWADAEWSYTPHLYYALVDRDGTLLTPPTIFYTARDRETPVILLNNYGYHNAFYRWSPPPGVDAVAKIGPELAAGPPGGFAQLEIRYANYGARLSTGTRITATLGSGLTYEGDTSGIVPIQIRNRENQVIWQVPDLPLLEQRSFWLRVGIPENAAYGSRYPVSVEIASQEPENAPEDNQNTRQVMAARQLHLPHVQHWY